ncbi:unnamed protein product [Linum trigynum]|uniref:Uncharacterized protein n=1 Tax=Linum trigynum TaxID=586398 RepID=A0AAV2CJ89_9ROSI
MRGALSSLLVRCSLLGRWTLQIIVAFLDASLANQARRRSQARDDGFFLGKGDSGNGDEDLGILYPPRQINYDGVRHPTAAVFCRKEKRKRQIADGGTETKSGQLCRKRRRQIGGGWRFWLPTSLELDYEVSNWDSSLGTGACKQNDATSAALCQTFLAPTPPFGDVISTPMAVLGLAKSNVNCGRATAGDLMSPRATTPAVARRPSTTGTKFLWKMRGGCFPDFRPALAGIWGFNIWITNPNNRN